MKEFDELNNPEINDFRFKMRKLGDEIAVKRGKYTWLEKLYYQFPPRLCPRNKNFPETLSQKKDIKISTKFDDNEVNFIYFVYLQCVQKWNKCGQNLAKLFLNQSFKRFFISCIFYHQIWNFLFWTNGPKNKIKK